MMMMMMMFLTIMSRVSKMINDLTWKHGMKKKKKMKKKETGQRVAMDCATIFHPTNEQRVRVVVSIASYWIQLHSMSTVNNTIGGLQD